MWENTREFESYGSLIARNRKLLKEHFEKVTKGVRTEVSFEEAKDVLYGLLRQHFKDFNDDKLKCVLRAAEVQGATSEGLGSQYDYTRILDVLKSRHAGP